MREPRGQWTLPLVNLLQEWCESWATAAHRQRPRNLGAISLRMYGVAVRASAMACAYYYRLRSDFLSRHVECSRGPVWSHHCLECVPAVRLIAMNPPPHTHTTPSILPQSRPPLRFAPTCPHLCGRGSQAGGERYQHGPRCPWERPAVTSV